ncbi:MAG: dockerin type I repeat-containing protein [Bacteroidaceae bacterium]|nr:dockerin type I repeat-containing protein [Bacteroidaceae bacterium]
MRRLHIFILYALLPLLAFADDGITYRYWFDQETQVVTGTVPSTGSLHLDADVTGLCEGMHSLRIQVIQGDSLPSPTFTRMFIKVADAATLQALKCYYTIDGNSSHTVREATRISGQTYHFDLDMSTLTSGLHRLTYWLSNERETQTNMRTAYFVKTTAGGDGITQFQYWLNDRYSQRQTVDFDPRQATVHLTTPLQLEQLPLRPCDFQFALEQGEPYIYAANDLHLMFLDASHRMTNSLHRIIDRRVRIHVEPVGEARESQTFACPAESEIRWYTLTANAGDSLSLRTNVASTLQLFSPSAQETIKITGNASTSASGLRLSETGTYYLAVHSPSGSGNMTLYAERPNILKGDVNGDGTISIADVTTLVNYILGKTTDNEPAMEAADVNNDNSISIADVTALVNKILGKETTP